MADTNSTNLKEQDRADNLHSEKLRSQLREMRRANAAIGAVCTVLREDFHNSECSMPEAGSYIRLEPDDVLSLLYAIEICTTSINRNFERLDVIGDVNWEDEYCPSARREGELELRARRDEIGPDEFMRLVNDGTYLRTGKST